MEQKNNHNRSFLANHLTLLAIVILLSGVLYLYLRNTTTMLAGGVTLLLAHIALATGIFLVARGWLGKAFRKLLGSSPRIRRHDDVQQS
jgi:hypothetical protein